MKPNQTKKYYSCSFNDFYSPYILVVAASAWSSNSEHGVHASLVRHGNILVRHAIYLLVGLV